MEPQNLSAAAEARRLAALHALDLLDTAPQREFDALVTLAADMLHCPAAITLVDRERLWVKARHGDLPDELSRDVSMCDHTIRQFDPMIVDDLRSDPRFADGPLVADGLRFYAGAPIRARDEAGELHAIGAICVTDTAPRSLSYEGRAALQHLATLAEALIAARATAIAAIEMSADSERQARALERQKRVFEQAERMAMIGSWRLRLADDDLSWSDQVFHIHGLPIGQFPSLDGALDFYPPASRALVADKLARTIETGEAFDFETDFVTARGVLRRVRSQAELEYDADGRPVAIIGVFQDITAAHRLEEQLRRSADIDFLTGINNRAAFDRALDRAMATARETDTPLALAIIDLDGFKHINDTFGHHVGDDALRAIAERLSDDWLDGCTAGRLGGDEFALVIEDPALLADLDDFAVRLAAWLRVTLIVDGVPVLCGGSVGVAPFTGDEPIRDFLRRADMRLYEAKRRRIGRRRAA